MDAKELKQRLTDNDIVKILESLGGNIYKETEEYIILNTICHGGNSNKLYYYKETKMFHCYTHCGSLDILSIISEVKDISLTQSINYICTLLGISTMKQGFVDDGIEVINDWSFIRGYKRKNKQINEYNDFYDEQILNIFQNIYTSEWKDDGISEEAMKQFNIKYSTLQQKIIIPHYDINNKLIGIRGRALIDEDVNVWGKYTPFYIHGTLYNHPLSQNLYGIHINKECIKRVRKVMLVESEKGTLQSESMFGKNNNFTLSLCGCAKISSTQMNLLLKLGVEEVIIALDRQYKVVGDEEYYQWMTHIKEKIVSPLSPYFKVYVLWDTEDLLGYKESPTDKGKETLLKLMQKKIYVPAQ